MNCKNCGAPIAEGTKFCMNCGSMVETIERVEAETVSEPEPVKIVEDNYNNGYDAGNKPMGNTLAIVSLVLGVLSVLCCCLSTVSIALAIAALITGIISVKSTPNGKGMAIAGIVMGAVMTLMGTIGIIGGMAYMNMLMPNGADFSNFDNFEEFEDIFNNFEF